MSINKSDDLVLTAGFAQFPKGTTVYETQKVIGCILVIHSKTNIITEANFTFISETTNKFIANLLVNQDISNGIEYILDEMDEKILFPGKKALMQAVISAYNIYKEEVLISV